ncbi:flagellar basal-body rod protein FlgG [Alkalilimnicola sp. S0819]|uniref:flagellar basal-body rod protein FlgG n=1 Tax=Alkalilimnicola sp. S0819 TaxID=2613922 RepID=UPI001262702C|nr:flagellar basal-body rod protein FlgG [Alkalilimnicola sp. S0819]KAB7627196.1 flagellar basal-body rod protein FlgG [Alkalilimnicola sp. S0819]MPQ15909.1 flagellar basal-body rod protein FlgG [Alkalilimnicola sp. S0819]
MNPALWVAKTGLDAQQTRMSVVSNNLANVNTTGFKKDRAKFEDLVYQTVRQAGGQATQDSRLPSGLNLGTGVRVVATEKMHTQGNLMQTGNSLDLAVDGRGFFQIAQPGGSVAYTRDGSFQINDQGEVVTAGGLRLEPAINVPANTQSISIGQDGTVSATVQGQAQPVQVGNIQLADFINPAGLQAVGGNLYVETAGSGPAQVGAPGLNGIGSVQQGMLESSNVNIAEELVNMIETQRGFETNTKAVSTTDQMLQFITNNL